MTQLILLPGMDGTGNLFSPLTSALKPDIDYQILTYPFDQRQDYNALSVYVLNQLPRHTPYVLLGESFSGPIAYKIASKAPTNLKGVIFVATFLKPPRPMLTSLAARLPWQILKQFKLPESLSRTLLLGKDMTAEQIEQFWQVVEQLPAKLIAHRLGQIAKLQPPSDRVTIPSLYIQGADDYLVPSKNLKAFKQHCQNLTVHTIKGPHFLLQAQPQRCAKLIEAFIQESTTAE